MTQNDVNLTILDNGFGGVSGLNDNLIAVLGVGSAGTNYKIVPITDPGKVFKDLTFGKGPLPQAISNVLSVAGGSTLLGVKVPTTTAGSVVGADATPVAITGATNASPIVITAASHGLQTGDVVTIASVGGNTAANGTFKVTRLTSGTFSLDDSTGNGAYTSGGTIQPKGINEIATGTSVVTVTGTIYDTYQVKLVVVTGGTIGVSGITCKLSLDGGLTYGAIFPLGTASTYDTEYAGVLNFAAGDLDAGDEVTYSTDEPIWAVADVVTAMEAIRDSTYDPVGFLIVGKIDASDFSSLGVELTTYETSAKRYAFALTNARDLETGEDDADWMTAILDDFAASESARISVAAGFYRQPQQNTGTKQRRPLSWAAMARALSNPLQVSLARVKDGSLVGVTAPADDGYTYHDERVSPGLTAGRFLAAKTILGKPGWFVDVPNMMARPGSTFDRIMYRRGMDKGCRIVRAVMLDYLSTEVRVDGVTGYILEKDAAAIETVLNSALLTGLVSPNNVSAAAAHVSRQDNLLVTRTLNVIVNIAPLAYLETIDVVIGFVNPLITPV